MEILVLRIDPWVTQHDLYSSIADALHTSPVRVPGQGLVNFHLLFPVGKSGKHMGKAYLTIAETSTASSFLEICSNIRRRPLVIERDGKYNTPKLTFNSYGKQAILTALLNQPFQNWELRQKRNDKETVTAAVEPGGPIQPPTPFKAKLDKSKPLIVKPNRRARNADTSSGLWSLIQFGVICDDGAFSIEDFDSLRSPLPSGLDTKSQTLSFGDSLNSIRILFNNIVSWSIDAKSNALAFELESPATFIRQGRNSSFFDFLNLKEREDLIQARSRYRVPLIGCHLRIGFNSPHDLDALCLEARPFLQRAGPPREQARPVVRRNLTDPAAFEAVGRYCANIDLRVAFQFDKLMRNNLYSPTVHEILKRNTRRLIQNYGPHFASTVLESLAQSSKQTQVRQRHTRCLLGSSKLQDSLVEQEQHLLNNNPASSIDPFETQAAATASVYHVIITPTRITLEGPFLDASNRVLRMFPQFGSCFIRVGFVDEDGDRFPVSRYDFGGIDTESFVRERIGNTLKDGITIAGRRFSALAWSSSALSSHQCWFVTAFTDQHGKLWDAERIRQSLGDFSNVEFYPARYGARLSQAFSATSSTIVIDKEWMQTIPDDYTTAGTTPKSSKLGFLLTDGVGQISPKLMETVWTKFCEVRGLKHQLDLTRKDPSRIPSAIQFRCGGAKGMLCVNPLLDSTELKLRPSMIKFAAPEHRDVEVAATSLAPLPARLNRPLINALEDLGVQKEAFLSLQEKAVDRVKAARSSFERASQLLRSFSFGDAADVGELFQRIHSLLGIRPEELPSNGVLNRLCTIVVAAALGDLKRKARIPTTGCTLMGVVDEFGLLCKNEIYAQIDDLNTGEVEMIQGRVMIGRSPTIHPGDVRMVTAVVPPEDHPLRKLRNVVVFNKCATARPLPSILGGGDLDGDLYTIYQDPSIFPQFMRSPAEYASIKNLELARPCRFEDLADFFVDFVINDQIGLVSHFHLQISDKSEKHSMDPDCLKLATLHSKAVDFRKTGQAVHRKEIPMPSITAARPDFLAQKTAGAPGVYRSERALGYLYRAIPEQITDMPYGDDPGYAEKGLSTNSLAAILQKSGSCEDVKIILKRLAAKHPNLQPPKARRAELEKAYVPLLHSFVYHLSRLASWIPESRAESEWLCEEEILVGTQVLATRKQQLKRRQERLKTATAELFPILRSQLRLVAIGHFSDRPKPAPATVRDMFSKKATPQSSQNTHVDHGNSKMSDAKGNAGKDGKVKNGPRAQAEAQAQTPSPYKFIWVDGEEVVCKQDDLSDSEDDEDEFSADSEDDDFLRRKRGKLLGLAKNPFSRRNRPSTTLSTTAKDKQPDPLFVEEEDGDPTDPVHLAENLRKRHDQRLVEIHCLYAACHLGATCEPTRLFAGNSFALVALGCLLNLVHVHLLNPLPKGTAKPASVSTEAPEPGVKEGVSTLPMGAATPTPEECATPLVTEVVKPIPTNAATSIHPNHSLPQQVQA